MIGDKPLINVEVSSPISLKAEIKTEIPKESSGRLLDAITDIFRPFSESRGLKADHIRLQREEVLIEIAKLTKQRLALEGREPQQVPIKFLIPFMEKASLEEDTSELVGTWAQLLATASQDYSSSLLRYVSVLAELSAREVKFLDRMIKANRSDRELSFVADAPTGFDEWYVSLHLDRMIESSLTKRGNLTDKRVDKAYGQIIKDLEVPGGLLEHVGIGDYGLQHPRFGIHDPEDNAAKAVLESLGLIRQHVFTSRKSEIFCFANFLHLTDFGLGFCAACDPVVHKATLDEA